MLSIRLSIPLLVAMCLAQACVNPPKQPRLDPYDRAQVHVDSEVLRRDTAVGEPIVKRDRSGDLVHITLPIRSAIDKTLYVDYWITFFDHDGQPISKLFGGTKVLQANTPDFIEVNSLSPRAADFQIDLRYSR